MKKSSAGFTLSISAVDAAIMTVFEKVNFVSSVDKTFRMEDKLLTSEGVRFQMEYKIMKITQLRIIKNFTAIAFAGTLLGSGVATAQENPNPPAAESDGAETLTRGPIHEAFAGTVAFNPETGLIVDKKPPELIEEVPPEQQLEGDNVTWIPGYWGWDEDQGDFLWISGIWRNLPPGRQWVPGYWADANGRHQWTSGYWEDESTTEVSYLPAPPKSVESGPSIKAPSENHYWIPGNWIWRSEHYAWRTGYWAPVRQNWSWTPAYYRWTNRGYVYVDGFWDYPVIQRGVVFAPIRFTNGFAFRPGYRYSPITAISLSVFTNHLFLRPGYGHYYFGDYYEPRYRDRGFYASYSYNSGRRGFDPIFAFNRWENRNVVGWERGRRDYFEFRRDHADSRPPRTWAALNARPLSDRERGDFGVADRFDRVVGNHQQGQQRFKAVDPQSQARFVSQTQEIRKFGQDRQKLETGNKKSFPTTTKGHAVITSEKINRSPVVAKKSDRSEKDGGPPARLQAKASEKDEPRGKVENTTKKPQAKGDSDPSARPHGKSGEENPSTNHKGSNGREPQGDVRRTEKNPDGTVKPHGKSEDDSPSTTHKGSNGRDPQGDVRRTEKNPDGTVKPHGKSGDDSPSSTHKGSNAREPQGDVRRTEKNPDTNVKPRVKSEETKPSATHKGSNAREPQGEVRRTEKKPEVKAQPQERPKAQPQERPRPTTPSVPQQANPRKNPTQQLPLTPGVQDGEKRKGLKKSLTE